MSPPRPSVGKRFFVSFGYILLLLLPASGPVQAQGLTLIRELPGDEDFSCPALDTSARVSNEERTEAARIGSNADQALILGDQERARDLLARATEMDPTSPELAYRYARVLDDMGARVQAISHFCRALVMGGGNDDEVGDAERRLEDIFEWQRAQLSSDAIEAFQAGLAQADSGDLETALASFDMARQEAPDWPDPLFNRGIVRAQLGQIEAAAADLELYLAVRPEAEESAALSDSIERLRELAGLPLPSRALTYGLLLPGGGQYYTGHKWRAAGLLTASTAALAIGLFSDKVTVRCVGAPGPGGECPPDRFVGEEESKPYLVQGVVAAGAFAVAGALEAFYRARQVRAREVGALVATEPREATVKGPTLFARGTRLYLSLVQVTF
jgi:tetratricopeptide (TPR) repeat protein